MKIGFIGLGIMGSRMAANLQNEYKDLYVYNRSKDKAKQLVANGATFIDSPKELAKEVDVLFTMLPTPQVVNLIALAEDGFLSEMNEGSLWIDCSTVNPSYSKYLGMVANDSGVRFLDAPVSGSLKPAENGELIFLVGGEASDIKEVQQLFDLMGKKTIHVGEHGMGSSMKMVINLLLGQSLVVFSEAVKFGKEMGIDQEILLDTLIGGLVTAPFIGLKESNFKNDSYEPEFPLEWMQKDLHLASITAQEVQAPLMSGNIAKEIFNLAKRKGLSRQDCSAVYKLLQEL